MEININPTNKTVQIITEVNNSIQASKMADKLDKLPYLSVINRKYEQKTANITCQIKYQTEHEILLKDLEIINQNQN